MYEERADVPIHISAWCPFINLEGSLNLGTVFCSQGVLALLSPVVVIALAAKLYDTVSYDLRYRKCKDLP